MTPEPDGRRPAGRRTLGPAPRPGGRYSLIVGLLFLIVIGLAFLGTLGESDRRTLGLDRVPERWPLPEFAVPAAAGGLEGDANVAQDDCETSEVPCPADARRTPACRVRGRDVIRVCDFFPRPLVLSFWFTEGGECEEQQDVVAAVSRRYRGRVGFLSLNVADERDTVRDLIATRGWTMSVGHDRDGAVAALYGVGGCPTFAYAYPGGLLQAASIGMLDERGLDRRVRTLLRATRKREERLR